MTNCARPEGRRAGRMNLPVAAHRAQQAPTPGVRSGKTSGQRVSQFSSRGCPQPGLPFAPHLFMEVSALQKVATPFRSPHTPEPRAKSSAPIRDRRERVEPLLLVEDKPELRAMLRKALERAGYEVDEAADGSTAVAKIRARRHLLVLSDLELPGCPGLEVLHQYE